MSDIFNVTAKSPNNDLLADKLRISLNRLAENDPTLLDSIREQYRQDVWYAIFGPHIDKQEAE